MEWNVSKEILSINPHQRIIFASSYVNDELKELAKGLGYSVDFLQKPFSLNQLINILEDNKIYSELQNFNIDKIWLKQLTLLMNKRIKS